MNLVIFDDDSRVDFYPLTLTRCIGDLRCGVLKLRQRLESLFDHEECQYIIDPELQDLYRERHPDWSINNVKTGDTLLVNSRLKLIPPVIEQIRSLKMGEKLVSPLGIIALRTTTVPECYASLLLLCKNTEGEIWIEDNALYQNLAQIIHSNAQMIDYDFEHFFEDEENYQETEPGVTLLNPYGIWIGEGCTLKPGVILDASEGKIIIDNDVKIMANAVIMGPAYIGKCSTIKVGAKIYPGTSIGPVCKIGGEVEGSIFQAYSNKQHEGFIGHSYIGEWVNIGADTNNSDLKNTYKNVLYYSFRTRAKVDSGTMFLGTMIGDHVKLGINCTINTGTVIGTGSNLWGADLISDYIPPFSWGSGSEHTNYRLDAFLQTLRLVKERRSLALGKAEEELFYLLHHAF